jgi:serine/threonine protein kinase
MAYYVNPDQVDYFHGRLLDEEKNRLLEEIGYRDGLFLLRENVTDVSSYIISICFQGQIFDYHIKRQLDEMVCLSYDQRISDRSFIGPIELITYYQDNNDEFIITKPTIPCKRPKEKEPINFYILDNIDFKNLVDNEIQTYLNAIKINYSEAFNRAELDAQGRFRYKRVKKVLQNLHTFQPWYENHKVALDEKKICHGQFAVHKIREGSQDHVITLRQNMDLHQVKIFYRDSSRYSLETSDKEFDSIIQLIDYFYRNGFRLEEKAKSNSFWQIPEFKNIAIFESLSSNNFGPIVYRGNLNKKAEAVAVKTFKTDEIDEVTKNILTVEYESMKSIKHPYIIDFIGFYLENNFTRIIFEFGTLGPFDRYLRENKEKMSMDKILKICYQTALAMEYLSSRKIVHYALMIHNILLLTESHSKLSDFGFITRINERKTKEYLTCYPPENLITNQISDRNIFDEKSCSWSFGILCWQATSYSQELYEKISIEDLHYNLTNGYRMEKPLECPKNIFDDIISICWSANKIDRPTFSDITKQFESLPIYDLITNFKIVDNSSYLYNTELKQESTSGLKFKNSLKNSDLNLFDKMSLGGQFNSVFEGIYKKKNGKKLVKTRVAIKLKSVINKEDEFKLQKNIELLESLEHPNIIKFFGACYSQESNSYNLIFELAPLGRFDKYLKNRGKKMSMAKIIKICYQVSLALEYLISKNIIHQNIALRKVLLIDEHTSKLSDFKFSRTLNENFFYEIVTQNKWPVKWYSPETNSLHLSDEKSEVWSFGVLCWEATSYGEIPYKEIESPSILRYQLENENLRLTKPSKCPERMFEIISKCWIANKRDRPTFSDLVKEIRLAINDIYNISLW